MAYFVYILLSRKDDKLYIGCTSNTNRRLTRHNEGHVPATKHRRPLDLIHSEKFESKPEAFQRERFLKSLWAGRFKKIIKKRYLNQNRTR